MKKSQPEDTGCQVEMAGQVNGLYSGGLLFYSSTSPELLLPSGLTWSSPGTCKVELLAGVCVYEPVCACVCPRISMPAEIRRECCELLELGPGK